MGTTAAALESAGSDVVIAMTIHGWMLRGLPGDMFQAVLIRTESPDEFAVQWQAPVKPEDRQVLVTWWKHLVDSRGNRVVKELHLDSEWTPRKRLRNTREEMPTEPRQNAAWVMMDSLSTGATLAAASFTAAASQALVDNLVWFRRSLGMTE